MADSASTSGTAHADAPPQPPAQGNAGQDKGQASQAQESTGSSNAGAKADEQAKPSPAPPSMSIPASIQEPAPHVPAPLPARSPLAQENQLKPPSNSMPATAASPSGLASPAPIAEPAAASSGPADQQGKPAHAALSNGATPSSTAPAPSAAPAPAPADTAATPADRPPSAGLAQTSKSPMTNPTVDSKTDTSTSSAPNAGINAKPTPASEDQVDTASSALPGQGASKDANPSVSKPSSAPTAQPRTSNQPSQTSQQSNHSTQAPQSNPYAMYQGPGNSRLQSGPPYSTANLQSRTGSTAQPLTAAPVVSRTSGSLPSSTPVTAGSSQPIASSSAQSPNTTQSQPFQRSSGFHSRTQSNPLGMTTFLTGGGVGGSTAGQGPLSIPKYSSSAGRTARDPRAPNSMTDRPLSHSPVQPSREPPSRTGGGGQPSWMSYGQRVETPKSAGAPSSPQAKKPRTQSTGAATSPFGASSGGFTPLYGPAPTASNLTVDSQNKDSPMSRGVSASPAAQSTKPSPTIAQRPYAAMSYAERMQLASGASTPSVDERLAAALNQQNKQQQQGGTSGNRPSPPSSAVGQSRPGLFGPGMGSGGRSHTPTTGPLRSPTHAASSSFSSSMPSASSANPPPSPSRAKASPFTSTGASSSSAADGNARFGYNFGSRLGHQQQLSSDSASARNQAYNSPSTASKPGLSQSGNQSHLSGQGNTPSPSHFSRQIGQHGPGSQGGGSMSSAALNNNAIPHFRPSSTNAPSAVAGPAAGAQQQQLGTTASQSHAGKAAAGVQSTTAVGANSSIQPSRTAGGAASTDGLGLHSAGQADLPGNAITTTVAGWRASNDSRLAGMHNPSSSYQHQQQQSQAAAKMRKPETVGAATARPGQASSTASQPGQAKTEERQPQSQQAQAKHQQSQYMQQQDQQAVGHKRKRSDLPEVPPQQAVPSHHVHQSSHGGPAYPQTQPQNAGRPAHQASQHVSHQHQQGPVHTGRALPTRDGHIFTFDDMKGAALRPPLMSVRSDLVVRALQKISHNHSIRAQSPHIPPFLGRIVYDPFIDPSDLLDAQMLKNAVGGKVEVWLDTEWLKGEIWEAGAPSFDAAGESRATSPDPATRQLNGQKKATEEADDSRYQSGMSLDEPSSAAKLPPAWSLWDLPPMRSRKIWGTDVYTDDTDILAACIHSGWLRLGSTAPLFGMPQVDTPSRKRRRLKQQKHRSLKVTIIIAPRLIKYEGSLRAGVRSRSWGNSHDGVSYAIESVELVENASHRLSRARMKAYEAAYTHIAQDRCACIVACDCVPRSEHTQRTVTLGKTLIKANA